jgi:hypothetical protein
MSLFAPDQEKREANPQNNKNDHKESQPLATWFFTPSLFVLSGFAYTLTVSMGSFGYCVLWRRLGFHLNILWIKTPVDTVKIL